MYFSAVQINLKLDKLIIYVLIVSKCVLFNLRCQLAFLLNFLKEKKRIKYIKFLVKMSKYWKNSFFYNYNHTLNWWRIIDQGY